MAQKVPVGLIGGSQQSSAHHPGLLSGGYGAPQGSMFLGLGGPPSGAGGAPPHMMGGMPPPPMMEDDIIGAIKIKDGLFIGDEFAAQVSVHQ